jgi:hypothetical protein
MLGIEKEPRANASFFSIAKGYRLRHTDTNICPKITKHHTLSPRFTVYTYLMIKPNSSKRFFVSANQSANGYGSL